MEFTREPIRQLYDNLTVEARQVVDLAVEKIVAVKRRGGKIAVVTGMGVNRRWSFE